MPKIWVLGFALILLLVPFFLISIGTTQDTPMLWWAGLALLVLGALIPPATRFIFPSEDEEEEDEDEDEQEDEDKAPPTVQARDHLAASHAERAEAHRQRAEEHREEAQAHEEDARAEAERAVAEAERARIEAERARTSGDPIPPRDPDDRSAGGTDSDDR